MKIRKIMAAGLIIACSALSSCGNSRIDMEKWSFTPKNASNIKIGILQPVEHDALGAAREGFKKAITDGGVTATFDYQNANGSESDQNTLAKKMVNEDDLTLGIGTGASVALQSSAINSGTTNPILFTAVTDPVDAELVDSLANPGQNVTGTSDANPVEAQIDLIKECLPSATKMGVMYTQSETNSKVQADQAKAEAQKQGLTVVTKTCTGSSDITSVANSICSEGIQALYIPTDNNIAAHMDAIKNAADSRHVLVIVGEESQCKNGGHITLSIDYFELGYTTGEMAVKIIKGQKRPDQIPVGTMSVEECTYVCSTANLGDAGITLPSTVLAKCTDVSANS
ncbi:MAG: ABC transporter substrate-binding protein [Bacilli bacterium]|nr:ABC transporter substrate-binding protein [Bacilli bacterium]